MRTPFDVTDPVSDEAADWHAALVHDSAAFARLFDRHRDAVFRQALRLVSEPADAEEVASAAFFELWRKRDAVVTVDGSVRPWLLVTAANMARNSHRRRIRREVFLRNLADQHHDDGGRRAFDRIDGEIQRTELVTALRQLKPHDAALVTMTALEGYQVAEVARLLGISDGAARVRLHRAHGRLRHLLTPSADAPIDHEEVAR